MTRNLLTFVAETGLMIEGLLTRGRGYFGRAERSGKESVFSPSFALIDWRIHRRNAGYAVKRIAIRLGWRRDPDDMP